MRLFEDAHSLAVDVAGRLIERLQRAVEERGHASWVLTGGRIGTAILTQIATHPRRATVNWATVDAWWGDERFLPPGDPERNETQAREALLDHLPLETDRVHPMPAAAPGVDAKDAAMQYARMLGDSPRFDVAFLSLGPDGHVASLFPGDPALQIHGTPTGDDGSTPTATTPSVVAVHNAPKPPRTRLSLTIPTFCGAEEVWFLASGAEKADAVRRALDVQRRAREGKETPDGTFYETPAAAIRGKSRTRWFLDRAAASRVS